MASEIAVPQGEPKSEGTGGADMDYEAHEQTYEKFVSYSVVGSIAVFTIVVALVLFAFGGGFGFWLGIFTTILAFVALAIGLGTGGAWKPGAAVLLLGCLFVVLTATG